MVSQYVRAAWEQSFRVSLGNGWLSMRMLRCCLSSATLSHFPLAHTLTH